MPTAATHTEKTPSGLVSVDGRTFPLVESRLQGRAEGGLAHSTLTQKFTNPHAEPLEVIYTMPLPADGAVLGYTIHLGERIVRGQIEPKQKAREQYLRALEEGRTAGLLEQHRSDTFTQSLGNLPPGEQVRVEIDVLQPLAFEGGTTDDAPAWVYRFPTVTGVRYDGAPGRVPDADKLTAPRADTAGTPARIHVELLVADAGPATVSPRSVSHEIAVEEDPRGTLVRLAGPSALDRDLVVRWNASSASVKAGLTEGSGLPGDDGRYALLTVTPPAARHAAFPRDLTVLLDASGSMSGAPIEQAKQVVRALIESLGEDDRFEVIAFADTVDPLTSGPVAATHRRGVKKALDRLDRLQAGGATEMTSAIFHALARLRPDSQRQVVLVTDGYVGFEQEIIAQLLTDLPAGARLHAVGVSAAPNRSLISGAARAGRGVEVLLGVDEPVDSAAAELVRGTAGPVLTDVVVRGSAVMGVAPERPRDVFVGQPLLTAVELRPEGGAVELEGRLAGQTEPWTVRVEVEPVADATEVTDESGPVIEALPLGALYGRERVEDCELRLRAASGEEMSHSSADPIEALGLRHRIVTRCTSLVAISEDPTVDPKDPRRREHLAVELPYGVAAEGLGFGARRRGVRGSEMCSMVEDSEDVPRYRLDFEDAARFHLSKLIHPGARDTARTLRVKKPVTIEARILRFESNVLVVEFESPEEGICLPGEGDELTVESKSNTTWPAQLDLSSSTRPGHHDAGLTLRLAVNMGELQEGLFETGSDDDPLWIRWRVGKRWYAVRLQPE